MRAVNAARESDIFRRTLIRSGKLACVCAGLLTMATVNASTHISVIDSFDAIDDLQRTTPRSVPSPGTDSTQISSLNGSVVADRLIVLSNGNLALTGAALEMFGDSSAAITITYGAEVDWTLGGASAFDFHFSLTDGTEVDIAASVTTATGSCDYAVQTFAGDGEHKALYPLFCGADVDYSRVNNFTFLFDTFGGDNTFSLDAVGTTVVPLPAAAWLLGSALGLLGWIRHKNAV